MFARYGFSYWMVEPGVDDGRGGGPPGRYRARHIPETRVASAAPGQMEQVSSRRLPRVRVTARQSLDRLGAR